MRPSSRDGRADRTISLPRVKTAVPRVPANFIARDGLRDRLTELGAAFPVTLVCAPAGYGKTLLLADWVEQTGAADKAWVSLDSGDDDADRFWTAVLGAVRGCATVPETSRLHRLNPHAATELVAEVIDALAALPAPLYLVLDDLHEISGREIWHDLATLVRHQPKPARLILSTRADPPLPVARLRLQGRLGELRADALRFTRGDAAELVRRAGVGLDDDQVRRLVDQTAGWPAGLRLAARSLREVPDREAFLTEFAGNDRAIADFLVSEVLTRLPAETADVLRMVSVCDEVTPALAAALTGRDDAGAILAGLERDSSLVLGVGPDRQWFRTHPLLRAYLRADLTRQRPGTATELHETAATWFAAREHADKAFDHIALVAKPCGLVDLLRRHAIPLLLSGDDGGVRRALATVDPNPWVWLIAALAHVVAGEPATMARPDEPELAPLHRLVTTTHALACCHAPDATPADWPGIVAEREGTGLEAWARLGLGWTLLCAGRRPEAHHELTEATRLAREHGLDHITMRGQSASALLSCATGEFTTVAASCAEATAIAAAHGWHGSPWSAANHVMAGLVRLLSLDPTGALDQLRHAAAAAAYSPDPRLRYMIGALTGAAHADLGRRQDGLSLMRAARHDLGDVRLPSEIVVAGALLEHRAALELGQDTRAVVDWAWTNAGGVAELDLMHAWTAFTSGDHNTTEILLRAVLTRARPTLCPITMLEAWLLATALEIGTGQRTKARNSLDAALRLAAPANLIRPFRQADSSVRQLLLEQAGGFGATNNLVTRVIHAMSTLDGQGDATLTDREHTVLAMLSSPQSIDEMATDLSVSVNTVKTHVRAIYAKLGVNTRRAAVVAARQLGID